MTKEYYFISDLHIGGDGPLNDCEFEPELIGFLKSLESKKSIELIIVGDLFGFWEISKFDKVKKLDYILNTHKKLFNQFKETGKKIKITTIPGNHDHELICDPKFKTTLKKYNIILEPKQYITRMIAGKKIWVEHGSQQDEPTAFIPFEDKNYKPFGFHIAQKVLIGAGKTSEVAKYPWIRDIESVTPDEVVPNWLYSNYFYKELSPLLRYFLLPFILMLTLSFFILIFLILQQLGVFPGIIISGPILKLGLIGRAIWTVITADIIFIVFLLFISVPLYLLIKDFIKALKRYNIVGDTGIKRQKYNTVKNYVKKTFKKDKVDIFVTAHTHMVSLEKIGNKLLINTGTWLKRLKKVRARSRFLPDIYYPSFELSYFRIYSDKNKVAVEYNKVPKKVNDLRLTSLERSLIVLRKKIKNNKLPNLTYI